jgi:hypothetical protein
MAAALLVGCDTATPRPAESTGTTSPPVLALAPTTSCGAATFNAINDDSTIRLFILVDARNRPEGAPLDLVEQLPGAEVTVRLQRGSSLDEGVCNDVISDMRIDSTTSAIAGTVRIHLDPPTGRCGVVGSALTTGLVFADGTRVADIRIDTDGIDCFVG